MTWLDRLLVEGTGAMVQELPPADVPVPGGDPWAVPLVDPTLEALCAGLPQEDAWALREERAGILEHQAEMSREEAEQRAGLPRFRN